MVHEQISNCQLLPLFDHVIKQGHMKNFPMNESCLNTVLVLLLRTLTEPRKFR